MPSIVNQLALADLNEFVAGGDSAVIVSLAGLDMPENEALRDKLAESGVRLRMVPNKLARRAFAGVGLEFPEEVFKGNIGVAVGGPEDAIAAAKAFTQPEVKKLGKVTVRAAALEKDVLDAANAVALAEVPDQDTLRSKILGCLSGPAQQLVALTAAPGGALARVLQAKVDADGGSEG